MSDKKDELLQVTILIPMREEYQRGIHATSDLNNKINVGLNDYHHRLLDQACSLLGVPKRTFLRQVAIRAAAQIIGHYTGTTPPVTFEKRDTNVDD